MEKQLLNELIKKNKMYLFGTEGGEKASFRNMDLSNIDMSKSNLRMIDMGGADLVYANLSDCDLRKVNFTGANMLHADLSGSDLRGAAFSSTDYVNFTGAN